LNLKLAAFIHCADVSCKLPARDDSDFYALELVAKKVLNTKYFGHSARQYFHTLNKLNESVI